MNMNKVVSGQSRLWHEENGVIYFSVISNSTTGRKWIPRLRKNRFDVDYYSKGVLYSPDFKPTSGITTNVVVIKGILFADDERTILNIRNKAYAGTFTNGRRLFNPNAEVACLAREKLTNKDIEAMGLCSILVMHELISNGFANLPDWLLAVSRGSSGRFDAGCLSAHVGALDIGWRWELGRHIGFAFAI